VELPTLLLDLHRYFSTLGAAEVRRLSNNNDKPLRMVKTMLHTLCKLYGYRIADILASLPELRNLPAQPMIAMYADINLKSLAEIGMIPAREGDAPAGPPTPSASTVAAAATSSSSGIGPSASVLDPPSAERSGEAPSPSQSNDTAQVGDRASPGAAPGADARAPAPHLHDGPRHSSSSGSAASAELLAAGTAAAAPAPAEGRGGDSDDEEADEANHPDHFLSRIARRADSASGEAPQPLQSSNTVNTSPGRGGGIGPSMPEDLREKVRPGGLCVPLRTPALAAMVAGRASRALPVTLACLCRSPRRSTRSACPTRQ
jgi:hypothetical protein